ncbi:MAG TPA: LPXTG cell wall anchor domain-containing protein [Gemmatimonadaceae bacterium]|nr:LPXTG cell wall anchor domain-containing protein [Gemmatimonadaceae bacterium]
MRSALGAQQLGLVPEGCACSLLPDTIGTEPEEEKDRKRRNWWAILGATGLGFVFGLPMGSGPAQGLPFGGTGGVPAELASVPPGELEAPGEVARPDALPGMGPAAPRRMLELPPDSVAADRRAPIVPPRTATHLPLIAALGVAMLGGGGLLLRRRKRERRRRRRRVRHLI